MTRLDRLREIVTGSGVPASPPVWPAPAAESAPHAPSGDALDRLGGAREPGPHGSSFVVRRTYEAPELYGRRPLREYPQHTVAALDVVGGHADPRDGAGDSPRIVCLDLETTGLSGGAGTVPFIVGLGWFEGEGFHTCQYFLDNLGDERRMLGAVSETLRRAHTIITFNGRSFDGPVLDTRYAFHRSPSPLTPLRHVDLLHPSRHLWPADDGRLVTLEHTVLGLRRVGDVPGAEIPGRYVGFLRGGDASVLAPVLEHNRLDLVSLGALAGLACRLVRDGAEAASGAAQALGLGRVYEKVGMEASAVDCYRKAARLDPHEAVAGCGAVRTRQSRLEAPAQALGRLARIYRRQRRHAEAAEAWTQLLSRSHVPQRIRQEASVALAVHHEHRVRDLPAAQQFARRALETEPHPTRREAVQYRLSRLRRKIGEASGRGLLGDRV